MFKVFYHLVFHLFSSDFLYLRLVIELSPLTKLVFKCDDPLFNLGHVHCDFPTLLFNNFLEVSLVFID